MTAVTLEKERVLKGVFLEGESFDGEDLRRRDLSNSTFKNCSFDHADLSYANCSNSRFPGSTFRKSILYCSNFMNAKLAATVFEPDDAYGITLSLTCDIFQDMHVGQQWWYCFLLLATLMDPAKGPVKEDLKGQLIAAIGAERYVRLSAMFKRREI